MDIFYRKIALVVLTYSLLDNIMSFSYILRAYLMYEKVYSLEGHTISIFLEKLVSLYDQRPES